MDDLGKPVQQASIGDAVELLGFEKVPAVGSLVTAESGNANTASAQSIAPLAREAIYEE